MFSYITEHVLSYTNHRHWLKVIVILGYVNIRLASCIFVVVHLINHCQ